MRAQLYDCVGVEGARTGARRHPGVQVELLDVHASEASLMRASDARQLSGNVSADARAGVDAGVDAGAGVDVDVGAGVGAYGCEDASGRVRDCDHVDVGSLPSFGVVAEAALVCPEEEEDGCASVDAGARANGSGGTDCHACVHTAVVHAGGAHRDQDAMALVPM